MKLISPLLVSMLLEFVTTYSISSANKYNYEARIDDYKQQKKEKNDGMADINRYL